MQNLGLTPGTKILAAEDALQPGDEDDQFVLGG